MPNISAHMIVAREVGDRLDIHSDDYYRGNLLPDIINIENSHHRIQSKVFPIPDIEWFLNNLDFTSDMDFGFFIHLLVDLHYLEDYLTPKYLYNIFNDKRVYLDYDYLNHKLVKKFNLDTKYLSRILKDYNIDINKEKLIRNIECLNQNTKGKPLYLDFDGFSSFLANVADVICEELENYANKHSDLSIRLIKRKKR